MVSLGVSHSAWIHTAAQISVQLVGLLFCVCAHSFRERVLGMTRGVIGMSCCLGLYKALPYDYLIRLLTTLETGKH